MNPQGKHDGNRTREAKSAKHRDKAVAKIEAKQGGPTGTGSAYGLSVGEALQRAVRENA